MWIVVGVVVAFGAYLANDKINKRKSIKLRDSVATETAINDSQTEYDKATKEIEKRGEDTIQYKLAQEQYLKGFRDYRQGQYARAMEEFQAALSFFRRMNWRVNITI